IGYLGLVEQERYRSTEEARTYVHTAYKKARQMKVLVDDLFEYTTVRQTDTPLNLITFDMVQLLEQLAIDFQIEAEEKRMHIASHSLKEQLLMERESEKLIRVFNNITANHLKYVKSGNKIVIAIEKINEDYVQINIKNDAEPI